MRAGTAADRNPEDDRRARRRRQRPGLYASVVSHWDDPAKLVAGAREPAFARAHLPRRCAGFRDFREWMMYTDSLTYLPDDILAKSTAPPWRWAWRRACRSSIRA
jgi:hypothetical protein